MSARPPTKRSKEATERVRPKVRALDKRVQVAVKLAYTHYRALVATDWAFYDVETADSTAKACLWQAFDQKDIEKKVVTDDLITIVSASYLDVPPPS